VIEIMIKENDCIVCLVLDEELSSRETEGLSILWEIWPAVACSHYALYWSVPPSPTKIWKL